MENMVTLADVKNGVIDLVDILKLNALLDMKAAAEQRAMEQARTK